MIVLNYTHPLTEAQRAELAAMLDEAVDVRDIAVDIDRNEPLEQVAQALADAAGLDARAWQTEAIIVNPPGLAPLAIALIAEIHGRRGDFVTLMNVRPVADSVPTRYEIAALVNLQSIRLAARTRRHQRDQ